MKKIKLSAILLSIILSTQLFIGCGNNSSGETPNTTTAATGDANIDNNNENDIGGSTQTDSGRKGFAVSSEKENIPADANFNGRDFVILTNDPNEQVWTYTNMVVEEETGETIDDAYYRRNMAVEERLNIKIKQIPVTQGSAQSSYKKSVNAADNSFDVAFLRYNDGAKLSMSNFCVELNSVPGLDFTKPWWDDKSLNDLSIANNNYLVASDITIADNDNTWVIYFDKQMIKNYGLEVPYDLVKSGTWTFDKMLEMMKAVQIPDIDGKMSKEAQFGFLTHGENYPGLWLAANITSISKDDNDMPYLNIDNEKFINVWGKILEIMNDTSCKADDIEFISTGLRDGKTLFGTEILKFVRDYRSNDREFGIIPMPKFNEAQEDYHTYVAVSALLMTIPVSNNDLDTTGIILEAMAAEGHRTIMPAYYDVSIEGKFVRDVESIEMLDIAFASRLYDLGVVFNWGNVYGYLRDSQGPKNDPNISSYAEKAGAKISSEIAKTISQLELD